LTTRRKLATLKRIRGASRVRGNAWDAFPLDRTGGPFDSSSPLDHVEFICRLRLLRHLLRLAYEEWEVLASVPKIRLEKEPQGRVRWLEPDEEARLLTACAKSQNRNLLAIATVALETGLRGRARCSASPGTGWT
jgi:hypothetical protein